MDVIKQDSYITFRNIYAEVTSSILVWAGSGLSASAGLPSWAELHNHLCGKLRNKAENRPDTEKIRLLGQLNIALSERNYWIAFEILKTALGQTSYKADLREVLAIADKAVVPAVYETLWKLRIGGILNVNLDRLATKAFGSVNPSKTLVEFSGRDCNKFLHIFKSQLPFVANLHGISADDSTWVFTNEELRRLSGNPGYSEFISTCLSAKTILFLGISADDVAVGGHLDRLANFGIDFGQHFWVTHRVDEALERWAEAVGIRIIYYDPHDNHSELAHIFKDMIRYVPKEEEAPPVQLPVHDKQNLAEPRKSPEELEPKGAEERKRPVNRIFKTASGRGMMFGAPSCRTRARRT
jgi:eukaryotic-like serine/threonine-protein kinase